MVYDKPCIFYEDKGGKEFWEKVFKKQLHSFKPRKWRIIHFASIANIFMEKAKLEKKIKKTIIWKNTPHMIFIGDYDRYAEGFDCSIEKAKIKNIKVEEYLKNILHELGYSAIIKVILIKNCIESLFFCDLENLIQTTETFLLKNSIDQDQYPIHNCEETNHCPKNKLKQFTRNHCEIVYSETLHPSRIADVIDCDLIKKENESFRYLMQIIEDTLNSITR